MRLLMTFVAVMAVSACKSRGGGGDPGVPGGEKPGEEAPSSDDSQQSTAKWSGKGGQTESIKMSLKAGLNGVLIKAKMGRTVVGVEDGNGQFVSSAVPESGVQLTPLAKRTTLFAPADGEYVVKLSTGGAWTMDPVEIKRAASIPAMLSGTEPTFSDVFSLPENTTLKFKLSCKCTGNFIVQLASATQWRAGAQILNHIGDYSGETSVKVNHADDYVLAVSVISGDEWKVEWVP